MKAPESLETPRLRLRRSRRADARAVFERYACDAEVTRFAAWPRHRSLADTEAFLAFSDAEWERAPAGPYLIEARSGGELLGSTGLAFEAPYRASTGYVIAKDAWGRGYATEALQAICDLAAHLGVRRIYAACHPFHRASWHVLEKCGFEREATLRRYGEFPNLQAGTPLDVFCYARLFD